MSEETLLVRARGLQKDMAEFEQALPEKSNSGNEALSGLLGMKHLLFERLKTHVTKETWSALLRKVWEEYWYVSSDYRRASMLGTVLLMTFVTGGIVGGMLAAGMSWMIQTIFGVPFLSTWIPLTTLSIALSSGGFSLPVSVFSYFAQRKRLKAQLEEGKTKLSEDPIFLITSVQEYIGEAVTTFHSRLSEIRAAFERAAIHPRLEADELLGKLRGKRGVVEEMPDEKLPDKAVILREIDEHIKECEAILENKHPEEEHIATLLEEVQAQIWALHEYPKRLEPLRQGLLSQAQLLEELRGIGVRIQELQGNRGLAIQMLVRELRELRSEIGTVLTTMSQFQTYLEQDPRIGQPSLCAQNAELASARALAG